MYCEGKSARYHFHVSDNDRDVPNDRLTIIRFKNTKLYATDARNLNGTDRQTDMHFGAGVLNKKLSQKVLGVPIQFQVTDLIVCLSVTSTTFRGQKQPHYGFWSILTHSWLTSRALRIVKLRAMWHYAC
jgi:hypothetical protein